MLVVNGLIRRLGPEASLERVLGINGEYIALISLDGQSAMPTIELRTEFAASLQAELIQMVPPQEDPFLESRGFAISSATPKQLAARDAAYALIAPLVEGLDATTVLFDPAQRGSLIKNRAKDMGCHKKVIYRHLQRFWRQGQVQNAFIPRDDLRGGKGKCRITEKPREAKLGRKSRLSKRKPHLAGVNVTLGDLEMFRFAIESHYKDPQVKPSLRESYRWMCRHCYSHVIVRKGEPRTTLLPKHSRPSFEQFCYWYKRLYGRTNTLKARIGERKHALTKRPTLHSAVLLGYGPGSLYLIDATLSDVYLRSAINPKWIVGRPVVYIVKDVFSQMIVGLHVALEGPNWHCAQRALENAFSDKVEFCKRFGIDIEGWEWPCKYAPLLVMGDRGELLSSNADALLKAFGTGVANTAPYRADWKGIVERHFAICNETIKWLPGAVRKRERGERDHRLDALLDLRGFTRIMIMSVLTYNKSRVLKNYPVSDDMVEDGVPLTPLAIWNWGVINRSGSLKEFAPGEIRLQLSPRERAVVTRSGVRFRGLYYSSTLALADKWFERAGDTGNWEIAAVADELDANVINVFVEGKRFVPFQLLDTRTPAYKDKDWYDVRDQIELQAIRNAEIAGEREQAEADLDEFREKEIKVYQQKMAGIDVGRSKAEITSDIRGHREQEKIVQRKAEASSSTMQPDTRIEKPSAESEGDELAFYRRLKEAAGTGLA